MLVVLFQANQQAYALPSIDVLEVIPRIHLRPVHHAPPWLAGLGNLRGAVVPVVDLGARLGDRPASPALSTRIALVRPGGPRPLLGLLAEQMIGTATLASADARRALAIPGAPFLGEVGLADGRLVQLLRPQHLLTPEVESLLFPEDPGGGS